jgi:hypothetical protein
VAWIITLLAAVTFMACGWKAGYATQRRKHKEATAWMVLGTGLFVFYMYVVILVRTNG